MIKKLLLVLMLSLTIAACATTSEPKYLTRTEYKVLDIPPSLLECNGLSKAEYPDPKTMEVKDLNKLVTAYERHLGTCVTNNRAVKSFIAKAKLEIENRK